MTDTLAVLLGDAFSGTLTRLAGGRLRFDYDDEYRETRGATPLSVSMPTSVRSHSEASIGPWLWGLLPDNQAVLERWARDFHASASSPFSLLATPIGRDCPGAVRFAASEELDEVIATPGTVPGSQKPRLRSVCASCARTPPPGWAGSSPVNSAWPAPRPRRPCSTRTDAGACRQARLPRATSSSLP